MSEQVDERHTGVLPVNDDVTVLVPRHFKRLEDGQLEAMSEEEVQKRSRDQVSRRKRRRHIEQTEETDDIPPERELLVEE